MIQNITLKFGQNETTPYLSFSPSNLTIIVGPNNAGKTLLLTEIYSWVTSETHQRGRGNKILELLRVKVLDTEIVKGFFEMYLNEAEPDRLSFKMHSLIGGGTNYTSKREVYERDLADLEREDNPLRFHYIRHAVAHMDAPTLPHLALNGGAAHSIHEKPTHPLMALLSDAELRKRFRNVVFPVLKQYPILNIENPSSLELRLSPKEPRLHEEESLVRQANMELTNGSISINEVSNGTRSFVGLILGLLASDYKVLLLDEPDVFLHPPLRRKVGRFLSELAHQQSRQVVAVTHNIDFLIGCISSNMPVTILRLAYERGEASARLLSPDELKVLMQDSMIRFSGALDGLFYQGVVVCEGDVDRVFYQDINNRLTTESEDFNDMLYASTGGKDNLFHVLKLRSVGVPTAVIVDLDIIKKNHLSSLLRQTNISEKEIQSLNRQKGEILKSFDDEKDVKTKGINGIADERAREKARLFIKKLAHIGIFVVDVGEVEQWLASLKVTGTKGQWLSRMLNALGTDPDKMDYAKPAADDVWAFLRNVRAWIFDPRRQGMD